MPGPGWELTSMSPDPADTVADVLKPDAVPGSSNVETPTVVAHSEMKVALEAQPNPDARLHFPSIFRVPPFVTERKVGGYPRHWLMVAGCPRPLSLHPRTREPPARVRSSTRRRGG